MGKCQRDQSPSTALRSGCIGSPSSTRFLKSPWIHWKDNQGCWYQSWNCRVIHRSQALCSTTRFEGTEATMLKNSTFGKCLCPRNSNCLESQFGQLFAIDCFPTIPLGKYQKDPASNNWWLLADQWLFEETVWVVITGVIKVLAIVRYQVASLPRRIVMLKLNDKFHRVF